MRALPTTALFAVAALILGVTLWPDPAAAELRALSCIYCGERATADAIANVLLFAPLGAALAWAVPGPRGAWRYGLALSLAIELAQRFIAGRDASIGDVIMNTAGAQLGWLAFHHIVAQRGHAPRPALRVASGVALAAAMAVTAFLLQPAPTTAIYYGQWTPNLGHLEWYRGRVLDATLDGTPLRPGRLADQGPVRAFVVESGTLVMRAIAGAPVGRLASLVSVYDEHREEIFLVGPDRAALVTRLRRRAAGWRLDEPALRFERALARVQPGDTFLVTVERTRSDACTTVAGQRACLPIATPGGGWSLLYSPDWLPRPVTRWLDALWLAALAFAAAFVARPRLAAALAMGGVALVLVPLLGGLAVLPSEVAAGFAGLACGGLARGRWSA